MKNRPDAIVRRVPKNEQRNFSDGKSSENLKGSDCVMLKKEICENIKKLVPELSVKAAEQQLMKLRKNDLEILLEKLEEQRIKTIEKSTELVRKGETYDGEELVGFRCEKVLCTLCEHWKPPTVEKHYDNVKNREETRTLPGRCNFRENYGLPIADKGVVSCNRFVPKSSKKEIKQEKLEGVVS